MRRLLLLLPFLLMACDKDDDGCKCKGKFTIFQEGGGQFFVDNVDCETGEPALSQQNETDPPVVYVGCAD